jgi:hypothetical protein
MSKQFMWFLFAALMAAVSVSAQAKTVGVGGCNTHIKNYSTISAAVGDPANAGATVQVCAAGGPGMGGSYPEQVTITQSLTLEGVANGNSGRTVVSIPSGSLSTNVISITGQSLFAQVLVQPPTMNTVTVNLTNITVDGTGGTIGPCSGTGLAGIFYASGANGVINEATARNQSSGCGTGIWIENGGTVADSITIENSSVENMDFQGIVAFGSEEQPTLTATIQGNSVTASEFPPTAGIQFYGIQGEIKQNVVTSGIYGITSVLSSTTIMSNVVADIRNSGNGWALYFDGGGTAQTNLVSDSDVAFYLEPAQGPGPTLNTNSSMNNITSVEFTCEANVTVEGNRLTDSQKGFNDWPGTAGKNQFYDVDTIPTTSQCL